MNTRCRLLFLWALTGSGCGDGLDPTASVEDGGSADAAPSRDVRIGEPQARLPDATGDVRGNPDPVPAMIEGRVTAPGMGRSGAGLKVVAALGSATTGPEGQFRVMGVSGGRQALMVLDA